MAWLTPYTVIVVAWCATRYHWTDVEKLDVGGLVVASLALLGFVVEHLRRETVSRWVGVIGLVPAFLVAGYAVAASFSWFGLDVSTVSGVSGWIYSVFTPIGSLVGVVIVQAKVTSPETLATELDGAHAEGAAGVLRGGEGTGVAPTTQIAADGTQFTYTSAAGMVTPEPTA
jgi:hypothetical protein